MTTKSTIEAYWLAVNNRDWDTFHKLAAENILYILPQTREMIRGRSALIEFNQSYPGNWTLSVTKLIAEEGQAVSVIRFIDNDQEQTGISFFELQDGIIQKITEYWPAPYDPPHRSSKEIERF